MNKSQEARFEEMAIIDAVDGRFCISLSNYRIAGVKSAPSLNNVVQSFRVSREDLIRALPFITEMQAEAVVEERKRILEAFETKYGVDGGDALIIVSNNEIGDTSQRPALSVVRDLINKQ